MSPTPALPATTREDALAERYGSPLYRYDLAEVRAAAADLQAALPAPATVLYSLKANPHPEVVRALRTAGCGAEVTSAGELASALEAGFPAGELLYGGPGKAVHEVAAALDEGVRCFSAESFDDLRRISAEALARGLVADCLLRINVSAASGSAGMRMTGGSSQFGMDSDDLPKPDELRSLAGVRVCGLHFYPVTNAQDEEALAAEMTASVRAAAEAAERTGITVERLDLGGGFGAPYAQPAERVRYTALRASLEPELDRCFPGWRDGAPALLFESGRYLAAGCGTLVCTVVDVKRSKGTTYAVLDAGINHLGGMSGLGRLLPMKAVPLPTGAPGTPEPVHLAGPLCTPADLLGRNVELAGVRPGLRLVIPNVGAYGLTASLLGFLSHPAAAEVVVDGDEVVSAGRLRLRREPL